MVVCIWGECGCDEALLTQYFWGHNTYFYRIVVATCTGIKTGINVCMLLNL